MSTIVTASDLRSGAVVYLGPGGSWVGSIDTASVAEDTATLQQMERQAAASVERCQVTAVYAFAVRLRDGRPEPISVREQLRATHATTVISL